MIVGVNHEAYLELVRSTAARVDMILAEADGLLAQRDAVREVRKSFDPTARGLQQSFERRGA